MRRIAFVFLLCSCTLFNSPDRNRLSQDAGNDTGTEIDAGDAALDGDAGSSETQCANGLDDDGDELIDCDDPDCEGLACGPFRECECRGGRAVELACGDGLDNDDDALVDCEDYDCASNENVDCCGVARDIFYSHERWPTDLSRRWDATREIEGFDVFPDVRDGRISRFGTTDPLAIILEECVGLAQGSHLEFFFTPQGDARGEHHCDDEGRCESYAGFVLSPVRNVQDGERIRDELGVFFHASGRVEVTQLGEVLPEGFATLIPLAGDLEYRVTVDITPSLDEQNRASLIASVNVDGPEIHDFAWSGTLIELRHLERSPSRCDDLPGLNLALEGAGSGVVVGQRVLVEQKECANPSQFYPTSDLPLYAGPTGVSGAISLDFQDPPTTDPAWASGAIQSPSLLLFEEDWHLLVEASNDQPELEVAARVGYALGHARTRKLNWSNEPWSDRSEIPRIGSQPPSCHDGSCVWSEGMISVREPFLFEESGGLIAVFAIEIGTTERFEIFAAPVRGSVSNPLIADPLLRVMSESECESIRDPAVVPRAETAQFWLFFTCVSGSGAPSSIRVRTIQREGLILAATDEPSEEVLLAEMVGDFGRDGVFSPEVVYEPPVGVWGEDGYRPPTYRLWFLGANDAGGLSIGLAVGQPKREPSDFPSFQPYPANPVLTDEKALGDCEGCSLRGFTVTRIDEATLRFLLARRVPLLSGGRRYELFPLDQRWRSGAR